MAQDSKINIYKLNECDWIAASSLEQAKEFYLGYTGMDIEEAFDDEHELSNEDLDRIMFTADEGVYGLTDGKHTFRVALSAALVDGYMGPFLFASTEQ